MDELDNDPFAPQHDPYLAPADRVPAGSAGLDRRAFGKLVATALALPAWPALSACAMAHPTLGCAPSPSTPGSCRQRFCRYYRPAATPR